VVSCRSCGSEALHPVLDLGTSPPSNAYLTEEQVRGPETYVPLRMNVCTSCWLMQTEDFVSGSDVFTSDYGYFSSMSDSWLRHAKDFVAHAVERFSLGPKSLVAEVASNDGYLLRFVQERGIPCFGVEPTDSTADAAEGVGIVVERAFLTESTAREIVARRGQADLVVANNVIAHVPDIVDFARGLALLAKPEGTISLEFAYGVNLVRGGQFDTVYHEHFSYLTLTSLIAVLQQAGLVAVDVDGLSTHGGSLRVFAQHEESGPQGGGPSISKILALEAGLGVAGVAFYSSLQATADAAKHHLLRFLLDLRSSGETIAGYGAAAKGNTLLNFAGIHPDLLPSVVDRSPGKVGKFLPGSRIPILPVAALETMRPNHLLLLPWNLEAEIISQLSKSNSVQPAVHVASPVVRRIS
jgi:hypothetical protein